MSATALSTAGIRMYYAVETTAGTKPTTMSSYTEITGIKGISDINPEPNQLECTVLSETNAKNYIPGLKDISGSITLTANNTNDFQTLWNTLVTNAETGISSSKATWFTIVIPGLTNAFYFTGMPSPLGLSALETDAVLDIEAFIVPSTVDGYAAKPTT